MEGCVAPLLAVELLFRSKRACGDLPHVVDTVSEFLDASVEMPLHEACEFSSMRLLTRIWERSRVWVDQRKNQKTTIKTWTVSKYLTTDEPYRQYEFSLCMKVAVSCNDLEMVKWLSNKFQGCTITSKVVVKACEKGAMSILRFFLENDRLLLEQNDDTRSDVTMVGHAVAWGGETMEAAILGHRTDIVWWLKTNIPEADYNLDAALEAAINCGEIFVSEWLLAQGAEWSGFDGGPVAALAAGSAGRLDVLKWLDAKGQLEGILGLVIYAAEKGHLDVVGWATGCDVQLLKGSRWLTGLGGEASLAIHIAATNGHLQVAKFLRILVQTPLNARERTMEAQTQNMIRESVCMPESNSWSKVRPVSGDTMMLASGNGHLDVVKWLFEEYGDDPAVDLFSQGKTDRGHESTSSFAMDAAARIGHLAVLKYLHELEMSTNKSSKKRKRSDAGTTAEVKFLATPICTKRAMDDAAANSHLETLEWFRDGYSQQHRTEGCTSAAWDLAAAGGHLGVLKWLHGHRLGNCTTSAMDDAAEAGKLDVVQWLHANTSAGCTTKAMDGAAEHGHLKVVQWLHAHRIEGCTTDAMDGAAGRGALAVVKWLHSKRTEGCTQQALYNAVLGGHLYVVKWLLTHRLEVATGTLLGNAALLDLVEVFLFLHDACGARCTEEVAAAAYEQDSSNVLNWIYGHYPALETAVANRTDLL